MLTAYLGLSFALKDTFSLDVRASKRQTFIYTSLVPLALYIITEYFQIISFTSILGIGGAISAGITGILILLMGRKAKLKINLPTIIVISAFFIISIILEIIK
ncbi:MAG: hypothetical protein PF542_01885 [Nanoarchaeota archaeon]|jgi:amino acid permease|nr:hypothetical protein [Nanoarchaeota archaeon]